jgi:nucleoside 2-deoxyribosyltransferase
MERIYVASSWRNPIQQDIVKALRQAGYKVYDFKHPAPGNKGFGWSEVNPNWLEWSPEQFIADLYSGHPAITRGFAYDKGALDSSDICVLVLPCGRSAHLEAGYAIGRGKRVIFYLHPQNFEPELMYLLGEGCITTIPELIRSLEASPETPRS